MPAVTLITLIFISTALPYRTVIPIRAIRSNLTVIDDLSLFWQGAEGAEGLKTEDGRRKTEDALFAESTSTTGQYSAVQHLYIL
jgi:hypothetical protein